MPVSQSRFQQPRGIRVSAVNVQFQNHRFFPDLEFILLVQLLGKEYVDERLQLLSRRWRG